MYYVANDHKSAQFAIARQSSRMAVLPSIIKI